MSTKIKVTSLIFAIYFCSCRPDYNYFPTILDQLASHYILLPEKALSTSSDNTVFAQYTNPTTKYGHGILGDQIEAEQLVVVVDSIFYELELEEQYVFEDIRPRLYDVDADGILEFITIRSSLTEGAGIVIYKVIDEQFSEFAFVPEIGSSNRWLNIVAIDDIDNDGIVELVWIETPHIGGILKIAKINAGQLFPLIEESGYSNHAIGQTNLCLSVLTEQNDENIFYVPTQARDKIVGFLFQDSILQIESELDIMVDFSQTLSSQFMFEGKLVDKEDNCIFIN